MQAMHSQRDPNSEEGDGEGDDGTEGGSSSSSLSSQQPSAPRSPQQESSDQASPPSPAAPQSADVTVTLAKSAFTKGQVCSAQIVCALLANAGLDDEQPQELNVEYVVEPSGTTYPGIALARFNSDGNRVFTILRLAKPLGGLGAAKGDQLRIQVAQREVRARLTLLTLKGGSVEGQQPAQGGPGRGGNQLQAAQGGTARQPRQRQPPTLLLEVKVTPEAMADDAVLACSSAGADALLAHACAAASADGTEIVTYTGNPPQSRFLWVVGPVESAGGAAGLRGVKKVVEALGGGAGRMLRLLGLPGRQTFRAELGECGGAASPAQLLKAAAAPAAAVRPATAIAPARRGAGPSRATTAETSGALRGAKRAAKGAAERPPKRRRRAEPHARHAAEAPRTAARGSNG